MMARKACVETFGCQMNVHDSERITGLLKQAGYEITTDVGDADLVVINTCSVRDRAEDRLFSRLDNLRSSDCSTERVVAVAGCVAQQEGSRILDRVGGVDVVVGTQALHRLPLLVDAAQQTGEPQVDINLYEDVSFPLGLAVRQDPVKAFVTIIEGCNDFCAFCVVPYTRGHERMRPAREIVAEIEQAVGIGRTEIHLLGQIVNHYAAPDIPGCDFAGLLERVHRVSGLKRIRFASPHPRHVSPRMIAAMRDLPKVCRHLHLPVQSGSTRVLQRMRRRYDRGDYLGLVEAVRSAMPNIALSTDMIVGFPGETAEDFNETLSLTAAVGFHSMFSFKYSERPHTLAAKRMPDTVSEQDKTRRLMALQALQKDLQISLHESQVGRAVEVLVDSRSRRKADELSGRTTHNTVVNFPGRMEWIGRLVQVNVQRAGPNSLWGEVSRAS